MCKKYEFIGGLKWGYNRKKICKNTHNYFDVNFLKRHLKKDRESIWYIFVSFYEITLTIDSIYNLVICHNYYDLPQFILHKL